MGTKINDEYTDLPITRQEKWAKRNPEAFRRIFNKWRKSKKGREGAHRYYEKNSEWIIEYVKQRRIKKALGEA